MLKSLIAAFGGILTIFVLEFGGLIEGRLAPVVSPLELGAASAAADGYTQFAGRAMKLRGCNFVRVEWSLGQRGTRNVPVSMDFLDPPTLRATGEMQWTGLRVWLDEGTVRHHSFADVLHQCRFRPWLVRSRFHDPG